MIVTGEINGAELFLQTIQRSCGCQEFGLDKTQRVHFTQPKNSLKAMLIMEGGDGGMEEQVCSLSIEGRMILDRSKPRPFLSSKEDQIYIHPLSLLCFRNFML